MTVLSRHRGRRWAPEVLATESVAVPCNDAPVRRRFVLHVYGCWLHDPHIYHARFSRDLDRFARTWSVATRISPPQIDPDYGRWQIHAEGPNWATQTDFRILRLDAYISARQRRSLGRRLWLGLLGLLDIVTTSTLLRYARFAFPYAILTVFPILWAGSIACLTLLSGRLLAAHYGLLAGCLGTVVIAVVVTVASIRPLRIVELLDNWSFSGNLVHGLDPEIESSVEICARDLAEALTTRTYDEVLLVGHSLGAALAIHVAARTVDALAASNDPAAPLALLTLGSSLLKIGLHPAALAMRRATEIVAATPSITWTDYQSRIDVMNFPGVDPVVALGLSAARAPNVRIAPFSRMISREAYRRLLFQLARTHNQYVRACTSRCAYDYFMYICGPLTFSDTSSSRYGAVPRFDSHGGLQ